MFRNVIVGVDRHGSRDAIAVANRLLTPGGELTLALVFPSTLQISQDAPQVASPGRLERAEMLDRAAERAGQDVHIHWWEDDSTGRGLHELCEITESDLLVVGSSRRGLLGRAVRRRHARGAQRRSVRSGRGTGPPTQSNRSR